MDKKDQIIELTKRLVSIPSIVNTSGENDLANFIFDELSELKYFKENPDQLIKVPVANDPLNRFNVIAKFIVDQYAETVIGIGHFDTVDVDDYGSKKELAFNVDELTKALLSDTLYLYGRGVLDMKSGLAIWIQLLKDFSNKEIIPTRNLVVGFVCDEENSSLGMKQLVAELLKIKQESNLNYLGAIDTDYTTQRYPDDPHRYVYFGTVGKLLVDIVAIGKETHASDPFLGLDANLLISAIIQEIVGNPSYTEVANGISTPVPISLKLVNPKRQYSVKTNKMAMTSINIITYTRSIDEWMAMIKQGVSVAVKDLFEKRNKQYKIYCENNNIEYKALETDFDVLFVKDIKKHNISKLNKDTFEILNEITFDKSTIIIYLSSPYYPAHVTTNTDQKFVESIMTSLQKNYINHMMVLPYYPYISDLSFLKSPSSEILQQVKNHSFDETIIDDQLWNIAKDLNIAMANIGPYGFDAHKDGERLESSSLSWVYSVIKDILIG